MLPDALVTFNVAFRATTAKLASRSFEDRVLATFAAWSRSFSSGVLVASKRSFTTDRRWSIFPPRFLHGLEATFYASAKAEDGCFATPIDAADAAAVDAARRSARRAGVRRPGVRWGVSPHVLSLFRSRTRATRRPSRNA